MYNGFTEIKSHPHVCGAKDVKGLNHEYFTPQKFIRDIIRKVPSYESPYDGRDSCAGFGYYTLCVASNGRSKQALRSFKRMYRLKKYVEDNKLGTITIAPECGNPNYAGNHRMLPAIFVPNKGAMRRFGIAKGWIKDTATQSYQYVYDSWAWVSLKRGGRHNDELGLESSSE